jgi:uncharacterized protein (DUF4213/DUF364 family)
MSTLPVQQEEMKYGYIGECTKPSQIHIPRDERNRPSWDDNTFPDAAHSALLLYMDVGIISTRR